MQNGNTASYTLFFFSRDSTYPKNNYYLPEYPDDKNREMLENVQNFYFLKSININELSTRERKDIVVNKEYLQITDYKRGYDG